MSPAEAELGFLGSHALRAAQDSSMATCRDACAGSKEQGSSETDPSPISTPKVTPGHNREDSQKAEASVDQIPTPSSGVLVEDLENQAKIGQTIANQYTLKEVTEPKSLVSRSEHHAQAQEGEKEKDMTQEWSLKKENTCNSEACRRACLAGGEEAGSPNQISEECDGSSDRVGSESCGKGAETATSVARKTCVIRLFQGDKLDANFIYTNEDLHEILAKVLGDEMDDFEIEKVQTASPDGFILSFEGTQKGKEKVHVTPVTELFSSLALMREHLTDDFGHYSFIDLSKGNAESLEMDFESAGAENLHVSFPFQEKGSQQPLTKRDSIEEGPSGKEGEVSDRLPQEEKPTLRKKKMQAPSLQLRDAFGTRDVQAEKSPLSSVTATPMSAKLNEVFKSPCSTAKFVQLTKIMNNLVEAAQLQIDQGCLTGSDEDDKVTEKLLEAVRTDV